MDSAYLAFDLGGSGGKLLLGRFDGERLSLEEVHRFDNEPVAVNGGLYWDLLYIYRNMNLGVRKAAKAGVRSIGIDSFSNDFAFVDAQGELLTPMRCYRDGRTERYRDAIYARMPPERLYAITGNQTAPFNTLMQLAAMREAGQGHILDNAHRLLFAPDLLALFMTGESASEYTIASVSQMLDVRTGDWSAEILEAFGIPRGLLCGIARSGARLGHTRKAYEEELGIAGMEVVSVCEHDTASAFLAAPTPGARAILSSGTWSLVGTEVPSPIVEDLGYRYNIANEGGLPGRHRILRNVMGLWIVQEIRRQREARGEACSFADLEGAAAAAPPFAHSIDPDDSLFYAPLDMEGSVARRCSERAGKAPGTLGETVRCVLESLALKYRWALDRIEELAGRALPSVDLIGGGSRNGLLCHLAADACGRPVLAGLPDATALGNILVQLMADGRISSIEEGRELVRRSFPLAEYLPTDRGLWEDKYGEFKEALR